MAVVADRIQVFPADATQPATPGYSELYVKLLEGEKLEPRQTLSYGCAIVRAKPRTRGSR